MASDAALAALAPFRTSLSRPLEKTAADLDAYLALLERWQRVQNLVSRETLPDAWKRHIADSLQILNILVPEDRSFIDLGSGGGLPAIPLAIALGDREAVRFLLVEPNQRKASFLRTVARELGLPVRVEARRANEIDSRETLATDVITSRALADLTTLCAMAEPFFRPQTRAIFHKGGDYVEEVAEAHSQWQFDVLVVPSSTSPEGVLLVLRHLRAKTTA